MLGTRRWRWSLAAPLLVLAGLFAMHGLGDHTGLHSGMHSVAVPGTHAPAHGAEAASMPSSMPTSVQAAGGEAVSGLALELCVAVLLGGLLTWLLLASAGRRPASLLPRLARSTLPVPRGRDPDPPSPELLSVHRC